MATEKLLGFVQYYIANSSMTVNGPVSLSKATGLFINML